MVENTGTQPSAIRDPSIFPQPLLVSNLPKFACRYVSCKNYTQKCSPSSLKKIQVNNFIEMSLIISSSFLQVYLQHVKI